MIIQVIKPVVEKVSTAVFKNVASVLLDEWSVIFHQYLTKRQPIR